MNRMLDVSQMEIMVMLATHMVRSWKSANRTWTEQYQYLLALLRHGAFRRNPRCNLRTRHSRTWLDNVGLKISSEGPGLVRVLGGLRQGELCCRRR